MSAINGDGALFNIEFYHDYVEHGDVLYRRAPEPSGFDYELNRSQTDQARCRLVVRS